MNMRAKLDKLNRRLLLALDRDARAGYAAISRMVRCPEETVRYRIRSLTDAGVISGFMAVIDAGKLGHSYYKVLLKLHNVNQSKVDSLTSYLLKEDAVNWVAWMDGNYDIGFTIRVKSLDELNTFIDSLRYRFHASIHRLTPAVNIRVDFLTREYLCGVRRRTGSEASYSVAAQLTPADSLDLRILRALSENARASAGSLAGPLKVSSQTILMRLNRLERSKVIAGYRLLLNGEAAGVINYYVLLYLNLISKEREAEFLLYCRAHPNVTYFIKALGEWDYELNIEVESIEDYRRLMMELTREFSDIIRDHVSMTVHAVHKLTLAP